MALALHAALLSLAMVGHGPAAMVGHGPAAPFCDALLHTRVEAVPRLQGVGTTLPSERKECNGCKWSTRFNGAFPKLNCANLRRFSVHGQRTNEWSSRGERGEGLWLSRSLLAPVSAPAHRYPLRCSRVARQGILGSMACRGFPSGPPTALYAQGWLSGLVVCTRVHAKWQHCRYQSFEKGGLQVGLTFGDGLQARSGPASFSQKGPEGHQAALCQTIAD